MKMHVIAWGKHYIDLMATGLLPSVIGGEAPEFLSLIDLEISTDDTTIWFEHFNAFKSVTLHPLELASPKPHVNTSLADQAFVKRTVGETMIFLPPDCVVGAGSLSAAMRHIESGKKAVAVTGIRCRDEFHPPPVGLSPGELTKWGWNRIHRFTLLQTWGYVPAWNHASAIWFECGAGYVGRCFHLHPLVLVNDRPIAFKGTSDDDLVTHYEPDEWHVVTDSDEIAMIEFSPPEKALGRPMNNPLTSRHVRMFRRLAYIKPIHNFFFKQRIKFRLRAGSFDAADQAVFPV